MSNDTITTQESVETFEEETPNKVKKVELEIQSDKEDSSTGTNSDVGMFIIYDNYYCVWQFACSYLNILMNYLIMILNGNELLSLCVYTECSKSIAVQLEHIKRTFVVLTISFLMQQFCN